MKSQIFNLAFFINKLLAMNEQTSKKAWNNYWNTEQHGCIHGKGSEIVNQQLLNNWKQNSHKFVQNNMTCFDLASGSGYLSNLFYYEFADKKLDIVALDYASVNRSTYPDNVKIYENQNIEEIKEFKNKANLIVSNFGFEYANMVNAFNAMENYAAENAVIILNCHHPDSVYSIDNKDIIAAYTKFKQSGLLTQFNQILTESDLERKNKSAMAFFQAAQQIDSQHGQGLSKMQIVDMFLYFFKDTRNVVTKQNEFKLALNEQDRYVERLQHQLDAAQNYNAIIAYLNESNTPYELLSEAPLEVNGKLISKFVIAKKSN